MTAHRNRIGEALATLRGAVGMFLAFGFFFIMMAVISAARMKDYGVAAHFKLGNTEIPKFMGAGASNLDVFILSIVALLALLVGIVIRYFHYRDVLEFLRSRGKTDLNKDGRIDSFADSHIDDFHQ